MVDNATRNNRKVRVGVVISGGNVDPEALARFRLERGVAALCGRHPRTQPGRTTSDCALVLIGSSANSAGVVRAQ